MWVNGERRGEMKEEIKTYQTGSVICLQALGPGRQSPCFQHRHRQTDHCCKAANRRVSTDCRPPVNQRIVSITFHLRDTCGSRWPCCCASSSACAIPRSAGQCTKCCGGTHQSIIRTTVSH